jgi:hypothetical protein
LSDPSYIGQVSAAPHSFHDGKHLEHRFRADSLSIGVDRAAIGTGILITDFLAVAAAVFGLITTQEPCDFDFQSYSSI